MVNRVNDDHAKYNHINDYHAKYSHINVTLSCEISMMFCCLYSSSYLCSPPQPGGGNQITFLEYVLHQNNVRNQ